MCILSQKIEDYAKKIKTPRLTGSKSVQKAIRLMEKYETDIIGIECDDEFVGIFTRGDYKRTVLRQSLNPKETTLYEVMTFNPPTIRENITLKEAYETMTAYQWEYMPVLENKRLKAIISLRDLGQHIMQAYEKNDAEYRLLMNYFRGGESYAMADYN